MKRILILLIAIIVVTQGYSQSVKQIYKQAETQIALLYEETIKNRSGRLVFPRTVAKDSAKLVASNDWTSGFFPGILWMLYEQTHNPEWQTRAETFTALMDREPRNRGSHDVGFKVYDSYGHGYRITNKEEYKNAVIEGAATLVTRFNVKVGCIRSWDFGKWQYPVIIDNMMNLELLFAATRLTGDSIYYKVAVAHANTTIQHHFRADFSSYHVVDYDTTTGKMISGGTHQGYADGSAWARGQAWALYGYTMCYRETKDPAYLRQAEEVAAFLLNHPMLPADKIPYWDFNVPDTSKEPRDASAAAVMASALYELKQYSKNKKKYTKAADKLMNSLTKYYRAAPGTNHGFILLHSTGHKPVNGEVDVPLIYADYYYLEALKRK